MRLKDLFIIILLLMADLDSEIISEIDKDDSLSDSENDSEKDGEKLDDVKISKEFQENVVKFVKLDDLIRKKQKEASELKKQRKPCEDYILKYLDNVDQTTVEITDGKLRKNKSETKKALNQEIIKATLTEKLKDPLDIQEILKMMEAKRPLNVHVNLKRTGKRQKKIVKKK
jgi:hypothetical protein